MKKETLNQLLQNRTKPMGEEESELLKQVIEEYPYFHSARTLLTKALSDHNTINFEKTLKVTAAHTADRSMLYHFLYEHKKEEQAEKLPTIAALTPEAPVDAVTSKTEESPTAEEEAASEFSAAPASVTPAEPASSTAGEISESEIEAVPEATAAIASGSSGVEENKFEPGEQGKPTLEPASAEAFSDESMDPETSAEKTEASETAEAETVQEKEEVELERKTISSSNEWKETLEQETPHQPEAGVPMVSETDVPESNIVKEKEEEIKEEISSAKAEEVSEMPAHTEWKEVEIESDYDEVSADKSDYPETAPDEIAEGELALPSAEAVGEISAPSEPEEEKIQDGEIPSAEELNEIPDDTQVSGWDVPDEFIGEPQDLPHEVSSKPQETPVYSEEIPQEASAKTEVEDQLAGSPGEALTPSGERSFIDWIHYYREEKTERESKPEIIEDKNLEGLEKETGAEAEKQKSYEFKATPAKADITDIIDRFIQEEPRIKPPKTEFYSPAAMASRSSEEDEELYSETLARINAEQGNVKKAVAMYEKLAEKYPEKFSYFAARIADLRHKPKN